MRLSMLIKEVLVAYLSETALSKIVNTLGDSALTVFTHFIYSSPLTNLFIMVTGFIGIVHFAFSVRDGVIPKRFLFFLLAWCFCFPVHNKPVGFTIVDTFSRAIAITMEKASNTFFKIIETQNNQRMPPWYLAQVFLKSSVVKVTDPNIQSAIHALAEDCIPEPGTGLKNLVGEELSILDLFLPLKATSKGGVSTFQPRFGAEVQTALTERLTTVQQKGKALNCWDLIQQVHQETRRNISDTQKIMETPYGNEHKTLSEFLDKYEKRPENSFITTVIEPVILNIAEANAKRAELLGYDEASSFGSADMNHVARESGLLSHGLYVLYTEFDALARQLNVEKGDSIAKNAADLADRLLSLPYYIACMQLILKIIAPLVFLTLLFGTTRIFSTWSVMWLMTLLFPVVTNFCGSFLNLMIVIRGKLHLIAQGQSILDGLHNNLMANINYDAIDKITLDFNRLIDVFLNLEVGLVYLMSSLFLAGAWFGDSYANSLVSRAIGFATNSLVSRADSTKMKDLLHTLSNPMGSNSKNNSSMNSLSFKKKN